jgi:3',5'-cyclic AMP phosphodiesterase CpdA
MNRLLLNAVFVVTAIVALPDCSAVDESSGPIRVPDQLKWRPTAVPDRIVLSWIGDPSTSVAVTWRTDVSVKSAVAEIAVAEPGPGFVDHVKQVSATTEEFKTNLNRTHRHTAQFTDLSPEQKYVYRVGDGTNWSEWNQFTTASPDPKPFRFVYFGDAQNDVRSMWSRVVRQAYASAPDAAFMLHAGDLINSANSDAEWGEWFDASGFIHRSVPCVATPGNHEYAKVADGQPRMLSSHWRPTFAFPENGPEGLNETCFWIDYQGMRLISLNTNEQIETQTEWLENLLQQSEPAWTVLTFHHPIYSSGKDRDNAGLRETLQPIFDRYKVDLVLQGHDHTYARTGLVTADANRAPTERTQRPESGTVYVVSVSGPKMYNLDRKPFVRRAAEDTQMYQVISVSPQELQYQARTATGELYDAFTLRKQPDAVNQLIEQIPDSPERTR